MAMVAKLAWFAFATGEDNEEPDRFVNDEEGRFWYAN